MSRAEKLTIQALTEGLAQGLARLQSLEARVTELEQRAAQLLTRIPPVELQDAAVRARIEEREEASR